MKQPTELGTLDALRELGFQPAIGRPFSDRAISFDFGSFELDAAESMSRHFVEIVMLTGIAVTRRPTGEVNTMTDIQFEMPRQIESRELCAAWIVWHLDQHEVKIVASIAEGTEWIDDGRRHVEFLPWKIKQAAYAARPQCAVARDWLRMALKELAIRIVDMHDDALVTLRYREGILEFRCAGQAIPVPGKGVPWERDFSIPAGRLRKLPNRLMHGVISVSVWDARLTIGSWPFSGVF